MMPRIHETAIIEDGVSIGDGTSVWDNVHIRSGASIGRDCIVGDKTYIGPLAEIGDLVKINTGVYVCTGVTVERGVMLSAHVVFTNDRFPRSTDPELTALRSSEPDDETLETTVREGATIGAGAVIGPGLEIGRFAMVGMGAVVTRSVEPFALVMGNPARQMGVVCKCGRRLGERLGDAGSAVSTGCASCGRRYLVSGSLVEEEGGPGG